MARDGQSYDVVIAGASVAGCAAATLYGRQGLKVALLDRVASVEDYKKVCTTFIQASALPTIERLGIRPDLDAVGAIANGAEFWTRWGWIRLVEDAETRMYPRHGYSLKRSALDPILRQSAAGTPGVTLRLGMTVDRVIEEGGRVVGLGCTDPDGGPDGGREEIRAPLIVAADGRNSTLARLIDAKTSSKPNNRFVYYAFFRNLDLNSGNRSIFWALDPDMAFAYPFPNAETLLCCFVTRDKLAQWKGRVEEAFLDFFRAVPEMPDLSKAERISEFRGMLQMDNVRRPAVQKGVALIGDAAIAADPMSGVGCGWALQSAEWLVDATAAPIAERTGIEAALARYARIHKRRLWQHEHFISDNSTGRRMNLLERMISIAAVSDPKVGNRLHLFTSRHIGVLDFLSPAMLGRVARANLLRLAGVGRSAPSAALVR